ncbi:MAG: signal recognition particle protein [Bacillales bacterium]
MAFESLTDKFSKIVKKIKNNKTLDEKSVDEVLKDVKSALLEADVNYRVVKDFINSLKEKSKNQDIINNLNSSETMLKIVKDELVELLGSDKSNLKFNNNKLTTIMMVGLQGSGKTTTTAKLAYLFKNKNKKKVLLAACDIYRPAAIDQLLQLSKEIEVDIYYDYKDNNVLNIVNNAYKKAIDNHYDILILDTAGRLQIDEILMEELSDINNSIKPDEILLLTDAMAGQDSVNVAKMFNEKIPLTGVIMSKMDGDSRGGAALSIAKVTNVPIKFIGVGEKIKDLDVFYPERMAERILGMGDVLTLIDKVAESIDEKDAKKTIKKMEEGNFSLNDMLAQMKQVKKLGNLSSLVKLIPGMPKISKEQFNMVENEMKNFETIMNSMTPYEREHPECLKNSRKIRIAKGSGKTNADINKILKKYEQSKLMMKQMNNYKKGGKFPPGFNGF